MPKRKPDDAEPVKVRVLVDSCIGRANTVAVLAPIEAEQACALGLADADPSAVEYAESIAP